MPKREPSPDEERRSLLPATLAHAATRVPYYRKAWGDAWKRVRSPDDLKRLPILTKEEARRHQAELIAGEVPPFAGVVSSGTTSADAPPLRVPHVAEEAGAFTDAASPAKTQRELVLEVRTLHHGLPDSPPPSGRIAIPWTDTRSCLRLVEELLRTRQPGGRRVGSMVIGAGALMVLTAHFLESGRLPSQFKLRAIGTYGFRLTPHHRAWLSDAWKAPLFDNYSLSEITTSALECATCGFHHWLRPPVLPEVVDAFTRRPLKNGCGVLVLTGLYPYVQAMPLIRYWTGDLVELGPPCRAARDRGFRFRGRVTDSLLRAGREGDPILVSGQDLQDLLARRPEVATVGHPAWRLGLIRSAIGPAKVELQQKPPAVRIAVRFEPLLYPAAAESFSSWLRSELHRRSGQLKRYDASRAGPLKLELVGAGP